MHGCPALPPAAHFHAPSLLCCARSSLPCRPQGGATLLQLGQQYPRVVRVRAEWVAPEGKGKQRTGGGWALKTKQERILM